MSGMESLTRVLTESAGDGFDLTGEGFDLTGTGLSTRLASPWIIVSTSMLCVPPGVGVTDMGEAGGLKTSGVPGVKGLNTCGVPGVNPGDMGFDGVEVPDPPNGEFPRLYSMLCVPKVDPADRNVGRWISQDRILPSLS